RARRGIAEGFERVVLVRLQTVLFENADADNGASGGGRVHRKDFPLEIAVVINAGSHNEFLVHSPAPSQENYEIILLRVFPLTFLPGDDVVGIIQDEIVLAADEIAQESRGVGDEVGLNS